MTFLAALPPEDRTGHGNSPVRPMLLRLGVARVSRFWALPLPESSGKYGFCAKRPRRMKPSRR